MELEPYTYFTNTPPELPWYEDNEQVEFMQAMEKLGRPCADVVVVFKQPNAYPQLGLMLRKPDAYFPGPWLCGAGIRWPNFQFGPRAYAKRTVNKDLGITETSIADVHMLENRYLFDSDRPTPEVLVWSAVVTTTSPDNITASDKYDGFLLISTWEDIEKELEKAGRLNTQQHTMLKDLWEELVDKNIFTTT